MQNEDQSLGTSMKSLEIYTGQKIQTLKDTILKRFEIQNNTTKTTEK